MTTETEYLRAELIKARGLLADCAGIFNGAEKAHCSARELVALPIVAGLRERIAEFRTHGVAALPAHVKAGA